MKNSLLVGLVRSENTALSFPGIETLVQNVENENRTLAEFSLVFSEYSDESGWRALTSGEVVALAIPQQEAPLDLPDGFQYFCLTRLPERKRIIVCSPSVYKEDNDGKLADGTQVIVKTDACGKQILWINSKLKYKIDAVESYDNSYVCDQHQSLAVLMYEDQFSREKYAEDTFRIIRIHPNEFPEPAGFGKLVWVAHRESFRVMKTIRDQYHHPEIVGCANTERKIYKNVKLHTDASIRVRCFQDNRQFYHVKAVLIPSKSDNIFTHTMSQSTHHLLAEKMTHVLLEYIKKEKEIYVFDI